MAGMAGTATAVPDDLVRSSVGGEAADGIAPDGIMDDLRAALR